MPKRNLAKVLLACVLLTGGAYSLDAQQVATTNRQQTGTCTGKVFDPDGEPVVGATVRVEGTNNATVSDMDGAFALNNVQRGATITVSYVGYTSVPQKFNGEPLYFTLQEENSILNELVVVGYGVQKKANLTGSVSSMDASQLENRPVASVSAAMAGEMPGVAVLQSSGAPGSQTGSITVRGNNTINSASPLVIVDGVPGSMNNIDVQDIESISVLKDAASAAIYGVQAANGVILITTKKGHLNTAPTIIYNGTVSFATPIAKLDPVTAYQYTYAMREAKLNQNPNNDVSAEDARLQQYNSGQLNPEGTNWWKETFKGHGTETAHTVQVNGGSGTTTYMASLGYLYQGGLTTQNYYNRYNGRMNLETQLKKWLTFGMQTSFYRGITKDGYTNNAGLVQHVNRLNATYSPYDSEGNWLSPGGMQNPIAELDNRTGITKTTVDQLFTNFYLNITPIEGLVIRPLFSWRHDHQNSYGFRKILEYDGGFNNGDNGTRSGYRYLYDWDWYTYQLTANYNKTIAEKNNLGVLLGYESQKYVYRYSTLTRTGGGDNALDEVLGSLSQDGMTNGDGGNGLGRQSWFARVTYDYDTRYLVEFNFRADASSRFAKENRWGYFPAASAAWRISQEKFMESTRNWLDQLKIRVGWGKTGNEEIDSYYPTVATYAYGSLIMGANPGFVSSLYEGAYVNKDLKWATVTNLEFGIEAGFFNNRLNLEIAAYKKNTDGMLLTLPVQGVLGVSAPPQNAGKVKNTGVDVNIQHINRINQDWSYNIGLNFGYNHNEIVTLEGLEGPTGSSPQWYLEGQPIGVYYGYIAEGVFKNQAEVDAAPSQFNNPGPGNLRFKDVNGDGVVNSLDRGIMGKFNPTWTGGLTLGVNFRDFDLSMLWQGAFDYERYLTGEATQAFYNNGTMVKWAYNERWSEENPNGTYPKLYTNSASSPDVSNVNSYWCMDASYVRLKNLTFGYSIPSKITEKIGINKIRLYFTGENLLTISGLYKKNIDPEVPQGRGAYNTNVRKLTIGLRVTF
ncbi:MAG: TonB-dependent receptor [Muribaculaceae bacterium]|nr:TonB-dependent receptor [Muribaculaceae bacterium]